MKNLTYTITSFDPVNKELRVEFEDGNWAGIRLTSPLPKDSLELEAIIKQFAAPIEAMEARLTPDADLTYIASMLNTPRHCERYSLKKLSAPNVSIATPEVPELDQELQAELAAQEQKDFEDRVKAVVTSMGLVQP